MESIFTKIIEREVPATIVYENDHVIAFKDINPVAKIHILVVPKKEIINIEDLKPEDSIYITESFFAIQKITRELGIAKSGYRVITNTNGGQEVDHIHFHILGGEKLGGLV